MKVTSFIKSVECTSFTDGEKWRQGENVKGILTIKNHNKENIELPILKIVLAIGIFKKIKSKDKKAWEILSEVSLGENILISSLEEKEFKWNFQLPEDCQITEKDKNLFINFFDSGDSWPTGQLELVIEPKIVMLQFLEIFENFLRFKVVQKKFSKGMVEVKLNPPNSRELSHVESLVLRMKEVNKILDLEFEFTTNVFEMVGGNMLAQKKCTKIIQSLTSKQYYIYGDSPNHDFIKEMISSVIAEATPKFFLPK